MEIVCYPHPALRHQSQPIKRVDRELREIVRQMFQLMYEARGVGLAANQVDLPLRLFVVNLAASPEEGEEMVFINPVVSLPKGSEESEEGCLSLPGLYGPVRRPKQVRVNAFGLDGSEVRADVDGLLARVIQHELDHLEGVLFIDRMTEAAREEVQDGLDEFEIDFSSRRGLGEAPSDQEVAVQLAAWEARYCV